MKHTENTCGTFSSTIVRDILESFILKKIGFLGAKKRGGEPIA